MTKNWATVKSEVERLYLREKRSLVDVRLLMVQKHNFFASRRAYHLKLNEWGFYKNHRQRRRIIAPEDDSAEEGQRPQRPSSPDDHLPEINTRLNLLSAEQQETPNLDNRAANSLINLSRTTSTSAKGSKLDNIGFSPLHKAVKAHQLALVKSLLNSCAIVNSPDRTQRQPLHYAVIGAYSPEIVTIIRLLVKAGASTVAPDAIGITPLHLATRYPLILAEVLKYTDQHAIDPLDHHGNSPLLFLLNSVVRPTLYEEDTPNNSREDLQESLQILLERGADVNLRNSVGWTPFHLAIQLQGRYPTLDTLHLTEFLAKARDVLDNGPGFQTPFSTFLNAVDWFVDADKLERWVSIAETFLKKGADPDTRIGSKLILVFCIEYLRFLNHDTARKGIPILRLIACLYDRYHELGSTEHPFLNPLIWNLPFDSPDLAAASVSCLAHALTIKISTATQQSLPLHTLLQRLYICDAKSRSPECVMLMLEAGADPLWAPQLIDRPIYIVLRLFDASLGETMIKLMLHHFLDAEDNSSLSLADSSQSPDYQWFWEFKLACCDKRWRLTYEDAPLPRDITREQKSLLIATVRGILADICIKAAETTYFDPLSMHFQRTWAQKQVLSIVQDPRYTEINGPSTWHTTSLLNVILNQFSPQQKSPSGNADLEFPNDNVGSSHFNSEEQSASQTIVRPLTDSTGESQGDAALSDKRGFRSSLKDRLREAQLSHTILLPDPSQPQSDTSTEQSPFREGSALDPRPTYPIDTSP